MGFPTNFYAFLPLFHREIAQKNQCNNTGLFATSFIAIKPFVPPPIQTLTLFNPPQ
jgi:hypothetical protein